MGFGAAVRSGFSNYATFSGRARRSEFWWWYLFSVLVLLPFGIIFIVTYFISFAAVFSSADAAGNVDTSLINWAPMAVGAIIYVIASLALVLPTYAVWARRLHDMGQSGWWLLLSLISLGIVPLIMAFLDSQRFTNQWGADPKANDAGQFPSSPGGPGYQQLAYPAQGYAAAPPPVAPSPQAPPPPAPPGAQPPAPPAPPAP